MLYKCEEGVTKPNLMTDISRGLTSTYPYSFSSLLSGRTKSLLLFKVKPSTCAYMRPANIYQGLTESLLPHLMSIMILQIKN